MKKIFFLLILIILGGFYTYEYLYKNHVLYNTFLPANYNNFEKDMFQVLSQLNNKEKNLLLNYSSRFEKPPSSITVKDALKNEEDFESTNEGTVFFSQLKEQQAKKNLINEVTNTAFITFVDFSIIDNYIDIIFSIKNKSPSIIHSISGDSSFIIESEKFTTTLDFNSIVPANETIQVVQRFNFSEYPALKDMSHHTIFKMNIRHISFSDGKSLYIN